MVYNPPIERLADGKVSVPPPAAIVPINAFRRGAYVGQTQRAILWAILYVVGWLLMRLSCFAGLPDDCNLATEPLEVMTDLLVLLVFSLAQAWFVEILEERRFRSLYRKFYFLPVLVIAALLLSAASRIEDLRDPADEGNDLSEFQITVFSVLLVLSVLFIAYHYAEAWRVLPGATLISGLNVAPVQINENLLGWYVLSRTLILIFFILYVAFSIAREDGWGYQHYVMAWAISLFAQFKSGGSVVFLAITTGIFLQGIGAYRLRFLCDFRVV